MGPLILLFWTSGDISSEGAALFTLGLGVHVTRSQRFTFGATPADLLVVMMKQIALCL